MDKKQCFRPVPYRKGAMHMSHTVMVQPDTAPPPHMASAPQEQYSPGIVCMKGHRTYETIPFTREIPNVHYHDYPLLMSRNGGLYEVIPT